MKKVHAVALFSLIVFGLLAMRSIPKELNITDQYRIEFSSENPSGSFSGLSGNIRFDENDLEASSFDVEVEANTINTGNGLKNKHAMGKGYFDVEQFPKIKFHSSKVSKTELGFEMIGILNLKGIEKEISFPFTYGPAEEFETVFKGNFEVDRLDFEIGGKGEKPSKTLLVELFVPVN